MARKAEGSGSNAARKRGNGATSEKDGDGAAKVPRSRRSAATPAGAAEAELAATSAAKPAATAKKAAPAKRSAKSAVKAAVKPAGKTASKATAAKTAAKAAANKGPLAKAASTRASDAVRPAAAAPAEPPRSAATPSADPNQIDSAFEAAIAMSHSALPQKMAENIERIESLGQRLLSAMQHRAPPNPGVEGPGADLYLTTAQAFMKTLAEQPAKVISTQVNFWGETLKHYARAQQEMLRGKLTAPEDDAPSDRRFGNPLWKTHPYFNFVKRQYLINANAMRDAISGLDMPDSTARRRVDWLTAQVIDMMAPTNFLATNPDALEKALETEGESLVKGMENLVRDVEQNGGEFLVSLADRDAFTVGENIGTAEGRVVHRAPLFELIQYAPSTEQVHKLPVIVFPPWINKFYILDLKPENSLIRWVLGEGHTLFVMSWKNPDSTYADTGMDDYVRAYLDAMDKVAEITGERQLNAVGYCIAGTTLSATLGLLNKRGDDRVKSATFFTTLTDFSDLGEFTTFLQDDFMSGIEDEVERKGLFSATLMSRTMSFLRANDLVWGPAIRTYMMGETPPAFDLLYWNGDSTNLPGRMTLEYLQWLCRDNALAGDGYPVLGERVTLGDVTLPVCAVACETDHIAPWKDCWRGVAQMGTTDKRFILSESGHIAGIVNPPSKKKYGHYTGSRDFGHGWQGWKDDAEFTQGSWWPVWGEWLSGHAGGMVPARHPDDGLGPAPGDYVHQRAV